MREKLTVAQCLAVIAALPPLDPMLTEMLPPETLNYLQSAPDIAEQMQTLIAQVLQRETNFTDLNLALVEYANESGAGQMMMDNLKLCLDQVRMRREQNRK